jgi:putative ABC transport system permease protein
MLKNYFKIALRNLWRNPAFSTINISGLAIGMATCLIILLFVRDEMSYDRYNDKADRIVRVVFRASIQGEKIKEANVMPPVAQTLHKEYPEVQEATRLQLAGSPVVQYGDKAFEEYIGVADSNFFRVFTLPFVRGDAATALLQPEDMVISAAIARKYFGNEDPMGKQLTIKSWNKTYTVTGVIDKVPANSHFHFEIFLSMTGAPDARSQSWMTSGFYTYLLLPAGYDYKKLEAKLPGTVKKYLGPQMNQALGMGFDEFRKKGNEIGLFLQPLTDIHLHSDMTPMTEIEPGGDSKYVYISMAIALFMLVIACINFMNLSTAGASKRAREVGVRKVLGSMRAELIRQFLLESIFLATMALLIALALVQLALPAFNKLAGKELVLPLLSNPWLFPGLLLFGLVIGLLAGSYPAFFLSSFKPVSVLKGKLDSGRRSVGLRSGLVVFQFFISITLIVSATVVYKQLQFIQHKKLGYDRDQVLVLPQTWKLGKDQGAFRQALLRNPAVIRISNSDYLPAGPTSANNYLVCPDGHTDDLEKALRYEVDEQYIPTLGIEMSAGRNFSKDFPTDSTAIILNETAMRTFGWQKDPLAHTLTNSDNQGKRSVYHVIGVVKDFHFKSLHERISPLVMTLRGNSGTTIVKVNAKDIPVLLTSVQKQWASFHSGAPFVYAFLDERFNQTYQAEQKTGRILGIFAGLTIFVACLGLFGLATFTAEQRTKEIGIRKVLGANVSGIVSLLSKDFLKLVFIAFLIASPAAWLIMNKWLQDFAYRIPIDGWIFVWAAILALAITLVTISFQAIRAALANPVDSLRSE